MYEILRVPPGKGHMTKAYDMIRAYYGEGLRTTLNEFLAKTKSVYMIADKCNYYGIGFIAHKQHTDFENPIKIRPYNDFVYSLSILTFTEEKVYNQIYDLVRTIIRDCSDRMIIVENIDKRDSTAINALKNNGFKVYNNSNKYSCTMYKIGPNGIIDERFLKDINPKDDLHTIDKHICLCDNTDRVKELQDKYTKDLLAKNIANMATSTNCNCGCDDCTCGKQTAKEFLGEDPEYCCNQNPEWE